MFKNQMRFLRLCALLPLAACATAPTQRELALADICVTLNKKIFDQEAEKGFRAALEDSKKNDPQHADPTEQQIADAHRYIENVWKDEFSMEVTTECRNLAANVPEQSQPNPLLRSFITNPIRLPPYIPR